ncbi:MAG TPA: glycosyl hydrolase family 28-related protein [Jiangellaceae bacterium]|nr:glycosyl hydrolase family 28-related protein [Jiangellaceae bacterium]
MFSVEGSTAVQYHAVAYGATVDLAIQSISGIDTIAWSIVSSSKSNQAIPTITPAGTPSGATASFPMPSDPGDGLGRSFLVKLHVTGQGTSATVYRVVGAVNAGGIGPVCLGEQSYRDATYGWTDAFNAALAVIGLQIGAASDAGDTPQWNGSTWVPRRGWITPDIDLTGVTDATAAIQAALNERVGACVYLPDGVIRMNSGVTVPKGVTLTGPERGLAMSHLLAGTTTTGALINMYGTGKLFTMEGSSAVYNFEIYYPNQDPTAASPTVHDWTFYIGANEFGASVGNITAINPYQLYYNNAAGGVLENFWGLPISAGIRTGRNADIVRFRKVHFGNVEPNNPLGSNQRNWIQANGIAFEIDGSEQFHFDDCFAYGYHEGIVFRDRDADGFKGAYGEWVGGGLDIMNTCVKVAEPNGLTLRGFKISNCSLVGRTAGIVFYFLDTTAATNQDQRPTIYASNVSVHGEHERTIWVRDQGGGGTSYGNIFVQNSSFQGYTQQGALVDGAQGYAKLDGVAMPGGTTRTSDSGGTGLITDINQVIATANGQRPTFSA